MGIPNIVFCAMTALMVVGIMSIGVVGKAPPAPGPAPSGIKGIKQKCGEMLDFIKMCALYINKYSPPLIKPKEKCCESARKANITMFCKAFLIKELEEVFSPKRVASVAKHCNNPLPRFSKCGSYTVRALEQEMKEQEEIA